MRTRYRDIESYVTKDGTEIRELIHPGLHGNRNQSLAEATVPPGRRTMLLRHHLTEEIYHVTSGVGLMTLDSKSFEVTGGDSIVIAPGQAHCIEALDTEPLRILCCCSPAYFHDDTELLPAKNQSREAGS